jgi:curli biogenesis system outer membrane secretion channel CsgG
MFLKTTSRIIPAFGLALSLAACSGNDFSGLYDEIATRQALDGPSPFELQTAMAPSLQCLAEKIHRKAARDSFAVGKVDDLTGQSADTTRPVITHGATLMLISALDKLGLNQVERYDTSVSELELKYANQKLIGDDGGEEPFKKIMAGVLAPSDYVIVGGITELDFNTYSGAFDKLIGPLRRADRIFAITVAADLRLIETDTLKVVDTVSFKKQIFGREGQTELAAFSNYFALDISERERANEPIQTSVRLVIERAAMDLIGSLYKTDPSACLDQSTVDVTKGS